MKSLITSSALLIAFGIGALSFATSPRPNIDIGAVQQPALKGVAEIVPQSVDTSRPPPGNGSVQIFANFLPAIFNGAPTLLAPSSLSQLPRGWYEATISINDPWWEAAPVMAPVYVDNLPIVSFTAPSTNVGINNGKVSLTVRANGPIQGPIAFTLQNAKNITVSPSNFVLDFSKSLEQTIQLSWLTSGKNAPSPGTIGVALNPQASVSFVSSQISQNIILLPAPVTPTAPDVPAIGFSETKVKVPATLPQPVVIAPIEGATIQELTLAGALFFQDVNITWNSEITRIDEIHPAGFRAMSSVTTGSTEPTRSLAFRVPAGVTPLFEVTAIEKFVPPGQKKTVNLTLEIETVDASGQVIKESKVIARKMSITFVSDAPLLVDDSFAFRSVTVVLNRPLNVLENDRNSEGVAADLLIAAVSNRPNLAISPDSRYVLYTLPSSADSQLGITDSFTYTLMAGAGQSQPATVYVTVGSAQTRGDSVYYTAQQIIGESRLVSKPAFYGKYMPLNKSKLKKIGLKNYQFDTKSQEAYAGARAQLLATVKLVDLKLRRDKNTGFKDKLFADIVDSVQIPGMGLQLYAKAKTGAKEKTDRPIAAWVVVPPQPDTYWIVSDSKGDPYIVVNCEYAGNKPKAYFETLVNCKLKKISTRVVKSIMLPCCTEIKTEGNWVVIKMPKTIPPYRADLIIDSGNGLGFIKDFDFKATDPVPVPVPDYLNL